MNFRRCFGNHCFDIVLFEVERDDDALLDEIADRHHHHIKLKNPASFRASG